MPRCCSPPLSQSARFQYLDDEISWPGISRQVDEAPFVSEEKQNGCGSTDKSQQLKLVIESKTVRKVNSVQEGGGDSIVFKLRLLTHSSCQCDVT